MRIQVKLDPDPDEDHSFLVPEEGGDESYGVHSYPILVQVLQE